MNSHNLSEYLLKALALAQERRGYCAPNPAVGAVIVKNDVIIATGYHSGVGHAHAERVALNQLTQEEAEGTSVFVTLEPCSHYGRTPPCSRLLIERRVKAVYYAFRDPNPIVDGRGAVELQQAGILCQHVPLPEIDAFYSSYAYWSLTKKPWVTAKLAMSLDGKIAGKQGNPVSITNDTLRRYTHQQREYADALLTTAVTIQKDNPQLNVRLEADEVSRKPLYILDSYLNTPLSANVFSTTSSVTIFHAPIKTPTVAQRLYALQEKGARGVTLNQRAGQLDLQESITYLGEEGRHDIWVEAGGTCFQALVSQQLVQRALIYVSLKWLGAEAKLAFSTAIDFSMAKQTRWYEMGRDVMCELLY